MERGESKDLGHSSMKTALKLIVIFAFVAMFLISLDWLIQGMWLNATCVPNDTYCIQVTSDRVMFRMCLVILSLLALGAAAYFSIRNSRIPKKPLEPEKRA